MIRRINVDEKYLQPFDSWYPPQSKSFNIEYQFLQHLKEYPDFSSSLVNIPVQWENIFLNELASKKEIEDAVNKEIDPEKKYFTVCKYEGGPLINLDNCIVFTPTGLFDTKKNKNLSYLALPLITNKYKDLPKNEKIILGSYVGRNTHPIRVDLEKKFKNDKNFYVKNLLSMSPKFSNIEQKNYIEIISKSYFSLVPRGYGPASFRLYESFELGAVPVFISDDYFLPFQDLIDWEKLCIFIKYGDVKKIKKTLTNILETGKYQDMLDYGRFCSDNFFTENFVIKYIIEKVEKFN